MKKLATIAVVMSAMGLGACTTGADGNRTLNCTGATVTGAVVGGVLGNQLGNGTGKDVLTVAGAAAGGAAANKAAGC